MNETTHIVMNKRAARLQPLKAPRESKEPTYWWTGKSPFNGFENGPIECLLCYKQLWLVEAGFGWVHITEEESEFCRMIALLQR